MKKRNIVETLAMPGGADIEVEFPRSRDLPRIIDLSDDAESDGELADLVNGITPDNLHPEINTGPELGRERVTPYDPADDLTRERNSGVPGRSRENRRPRLYR